MIDYSFVARSPTGKKFKGVLKAENEEELKNIIVKHNYLLIKFKVVKRHKQLITIEKITKKDVLIFAERLNMFLKIGIPLFDSIVLVGNSIGKKSFAKIIYAISKEVNKGRPFSNVLADYKNVFPEYFRMMIYLGEISGNMTNVIDHLCNSYNTEIRIKKKITSSLFYPCLLGIFSIIALVVINIVVIPTFVKIFKELETDLPLITRIMIMMSNFFTNYSWLLILIILVFSVLIIVYFMTKKGKYVKDLLKMKMPFIKFINTNFIVQSFFKSLSILINSGIPIVKSFQISSDLLNNVYVKEQLNFSIDEIKRGVNIAESLKITNIFPQLVLETISIAERTGNLSDSLSNLAIIYEENTTNKLQKIATLIEPLFIMIITGFVVLVIIAIFIRYFQL